MKAGAAPGCTNCSAGELRFSGMVAGSGAVFGAVEVLAVEVRGRGGTGGCGGVGGVVEELVVPGRLPMSLPRTPVFGGWAVGWVLRSSARLWPAGGAGAGSFIAGGTGGSEAGAGVVLFRPVILPKNFWKLSFCFQGGVAVSQQSAESLCAVSGVGLLSTAGRGVAPDKPRRYSLVLGVHGWRSSPRRLR